MKLKQAILRVMGRDVLKEAVNDLELDDIDRRSVQKMSARLSRSRRATPEYLLEFLSEQNVKHVCELLSIDAAGRRKMLVTRLLVAAGRLPVSEQMSTAKDSDLSQVAAKTSRGDSGKRPIMRVRRRRVGNYSVIGFGPQQTVNADFTHDDTPSRTVPGRQSLHDVIEEFPLCLQNPL